MIEPSKRLDVAETYYFAKKLAQIAELNKEEPKVINLGIGSPDLKPHDSVIAELVNALDDNDAHQYQSYKGIAALNDAFATWYKSHFNVTIDAKSQVLPLIGSKEGVIHISFAFLSEGDKVLVPNPGYPAYSMAAKLAGAEVVYFDLEEKLNWLPDLKKIETQDLTNVKLMWINYPNMPTGGNADKIFFDELIAFAKKHEILICHDNPYTFILNDNPDNIFQSDEAINYALELTSCSKNYNMAGWRVGAVVGKKEYLDNILKFKSNVDSGMFKPIQKAASKALSLGNDWFDRINDIYKERKIEAQIILDILDCDYNECAVGMFVWAKIPHYMISAEVYSEEILLNTKVFITPGHIFGSNGERYLRISLCSTKEEMKEARERILIWKNWKK
jgi:aspartate/methionine/tyrosine aminotransferase